MTGHTLRELWKWQGRQTGSRGKWNQVVPIAKTLKSILVAIAVLVVFSLDPVQSGGDPLPKGEGRDLVAKKCQKCHGLDRIREMRGSREQWSEILEEMVNNGLELNGKDSKVVLKYLETHLGHSPKK